MKSKMSTNFSSMSGSEGSGDRVAEYSLQYIVDIVGEILEQVEDDQCLEFMKKLHERLEVSGNHFARYINLPHTEKKQQIETRRSNGTTIAMDPLTVTSMRLQSSSTQSNSEVFRHNETTYTSQQEENKLDDLSSNPNGELKVKNNLAPLKSLKNEGKLKPSFVKNFQIYSVVESEIVETISKTWLPMESLRNEGKFKPSFVKNIEFLSRDYAAWRRVRGDGNCYYRAVMSNYILKIFHYYSNKERINKLIILLDGIRGELPHDFIAAKDYFIDYLTKHYESRQNIEASIESFKNVNQRLQERDFDLNLVRIARVILVDAFRGRSGDYSAFKLDDQKPEFSKHLLEMGREAKEQEFLLLPLGLDICVEHINVFENLLRTVYPNEEEGNKKDKVKITIISKNNDHYDILYPVKDMGDEGYNIDLGRYYYTSF